MIPVLVLAWWLSSTAELILKMGEEDALGTHCWASSVLQPPKDVL